MRAFIVVCLVATAFAQYSYQPSSGESNLSGIGNGGNTGGLVGNGGSLGRPGGSLGGLGGTLGGHSDSIEGLAGSSGGYGGSGGDPGGNLDALGGSLGGLGGSLAGLGGSLAGFGGSSGGPGGKLGELGDSLAGLGLGLGGLGGALGEPEGDLSGPGGGQSAASKNGNSASPQGDFPTASRNEPSMAAPVELQKEYYIFSANENDFNDPATSNQIANSMKQSLRVIFIKGSENKGLEDAVLGLAKQAAQQKTDIYVLNKQTDISELANKLNNIGNTASNKPDVHFVKYRTPEDAVNAQRAIQGEYDNLGGPSQSIDGGIAPVLNFASRPPASNGVGAGSSTPSGSYLPASVFRF